MDTKRTSVSEDDDVLKPLQNMSCEHLKKVFDKIRRWLGGHVVDESK